jgi:hypothetical protein
MRLAFDTLVATHRLWRDWDHLAQPASATPTPPFWDTESMLSAQPHGVTEVFSKLHVKAPDRFRVETEDIVWLSSAGRWWRWGGNSVALTGKDEPVGHLELDRIAWLLDPDHEGIGWGRRPDGIGEIAELQNAVYNEPLDDSLFDPPPLEFRDQADVLPGPFSSPNEAALRMPFRMYFPDSVPAAGMEVMIVAELLGPWVSVMLGREPLIVFTERPVSEDIEPIFERRHSRSGVPYFYAREFRDGVEIVVESALTEEETRQLISDLEPVLS